MFRFTIRDVLWLTCGMFWWAGNMSGMEQNPYEAPAQSEKNGQGQALAKALRLIMFGVGFAIPIAALVALIIFLAMHGVVI